MNTTVHTLEVALDWDLIRVISRIDRFDANWSSIERKEGKSLKQLKFIATVSSVGASTRIEGVTMSDEEIEHLLVNESTRILEDRDSQEVMGYFDALDVIFEDYEGIRITEGDLRNLHNGLMKYSEKDTWHKGDYKQVSNSVEANLPDGTTRIIFQTAEPGLETEELMRNLIDWYHADEKTHTLVKCAICAYELLSIHPFQDGNGRLSRLISTLILMKEGYVWVQYVSFEHEIENRKAEYYRVLRACQANRPNEDVTAWVTFFLDALLNIQNKLMKKLDTQGAEAKLSTDPRSVYIYIQNHPSCSAGDIRNSLGLKKTRLSEILNQLMDEHKMIDREGSGKGTKYVIM